MVTPLNDRGLNLLQIRDVSIVLSPNQRQERTLTEATKKIHEGQYGIFLVDLTSYLNHSIVDR